MAQNRPSPLRRLLAWIAFLAGTVIWFFPSGLVELIVEEKPILLNRYSEDRFFTFLSVTVILWALAGLLRSSMKFGREMAFRVIAVSVTIGITVFVVMVGSYILVTPDMSSSWPIPFRAGTTSSCRASCATGRPTSTSS